MVETEFWGQITNPNLLVELAVDDVAALTTALACHAGEARAIPAMRDCQHGGLTTCAAAQNLMVNEAGSRRVLCLARFIGLNNGRATD